MIDPDRPNDSPADAIDATFTVTHVHRLRFTRDVLGGQGDEGHVLLDLLERDPSRPARVLAIVEAGVEARQSTAAKMRALADRAGDAFELVDVLAVAGGEAVKNDVEGLLPILRGVFDHGIDRRGYVLAVGGGALLDAVGLAAALAHRGIRLIRLPTTTLGQADSGVGVKNAVNFFGKKNWLGSFAVPWAVVNDRALLATLGDRDWRCGFAEAVKVALLKDAAFFDALCADAPRIAARDAVAADAAIRRSAQWHLDHITRGGDPFELREARPLDFGHWSAHRLEAMSDFELRHGEAVAIGLAIDCLYSTIAHGLSPAIAKRATRCLRDLGIPLTHPCLRDPDGLLTGLEEFRQHLGGRLTVTMLRGVGDPIDVHEIDAPALRRAIDVVASS